MGLGFAPTWKGKLWFWMSFACLLWNIRVFQKSFQVELPVCLFLPGFSPSFFYFGVRAE